MNHLYAALELGPIDGALFGTVTRDDLTIDSVRAPDDELWLRMTNLSAKPRNTGAYSRAGLFGVETWNQLREVLHAIVEPTATVRTVLRDSVARSNASVLFYIYVLDKDLLLKQVEPHEVASVVDSFEQMPSNKSVFLLELSTAAATRDVDAMLQQLKALVLHVSPANTSFAAQSSVRITDPVSEKQSSAMASVARRKALLARARRERWPDTDTVGTFLGCTTKEAGRQRASRERAAGRLLGVWSGGGEGTFYHPPLQFLEDGRVHPRIAALLGALGEMPALKPREDRGGWGRLGWLFQPREALSELSLAEEAASDGIAADEGTLDTSARTPADVFPQDPHAVIALAKEDAGAMPDRY